MAQLGVEIEVTRKDWVDGAIQAAGCALMVAEFVLPDAAIRWLRGCAARSIAKHGFKVEAR